MQYLCNIYALWHKAASLRKEMAIIASQDWMKLEKIHGKIHDK